MAQALGLDQVREHAAGLEGGQVRRGSGVADRVPLLVQLALGEEDSELDLVGAGAQPPGSLCRQPSYPGRRLRLERAVYPGEDVTHVGRPLTRPDRLQLLTWLLPDSVRTSRADGSKVASLTA